MIDLTNEHPDDVFVRLGIAGTKLQELQFRQQKGTKQMTQNQETETNSGRVELIGPDAPIKIRYTPRPTTDDAGNVKLDELDQEYLAKAQTRFVLAAGCTLTTPAGILTGGAAINIDEHLGGDQRTVNELKSKRILLELDEHLLRSRISTARYKLHESFFGSGPNRAATLGGTVKLCGDGVTIRDFSLPGFEGRVGAVGFPELPVIAACDGVARFEQELAAGHIIDRGPQFGPHYSGTEPPAAKASKVA